MQSPFLAAVAHDLKSPLTSLSLWTDTLELLEPRLAACGDDQAIGLFRTIVEQMTIQVSRSFRLVDDVLDISCLQTGHQVALAPTQVDLVALTRDAIGARPEASSTEQLIGLETTEAELWGYWDGNRLGRVLDNLLSNAIKYNAAQRPIAVRVERATVLDEPHAVLVVEDRGIGIPVDELSHIFEAFHRGRNVSPSIRGNGLGLWFSRAVVERHGGTLTVVSQKGKGTTVTVHLPISPTGFVRARMG